MAKLVWDSTGDRLFETGVKNCALYVMGSNGSYGNGVAWNGITAITESPSGAEPTALYADDIKYLNLISNEEFGATVEAYTYPDEFAECDGSASLAAGVNIGQQARKTFALAYKTTLGNDVSGNEYGYKLHIIYGCTAKPSERAYATINDSPEAITFSWELATTPVAVTGAKPTSCLTIDSTKANAAALAQLDEALFGSAGANARLLLPDEVASIMGVSGAYPVANYLTNVENSNMVSTVSGEYNATLTAAEGYTMANVIVMMGGVDVTASKYSDSTGAIAIDSVTGPVVIYATANES